MGPGILPRHVASMGSALSLVDAATSAHVTRNFFHAMPSPELPMEWEGRVGNARFCSTCLVFRPAGGHHCRATDNCYADFDHFCGVVRCQ